MIDDYSRGIVPDTGGKKICLISPTTGQHIDNQDAVSSAGLRQWMSGDFPHVGLAASIATSSMLSIASQAPFLREEDYMPFRQQEAFRAIKSLPDNWNDHGAHRFSDAIINRAKQVLAALRMDDERLMIFPTAAQSIQIEWESASDAYCEIEVYSDHESIFAMEGDTVLIETDCAEDGYAEHVFMDFVRKHK